MFWRSKKILWPALVLLAVFVTKTWVDVKPPSVQLGRLIETAEQRQITDRWGQPLTASYQTRWNADDIVALHDVPSLLQKAFLAAEDKRFYSHGGVDWQARGHALWQNIRSGKRLRGASTITEQVVRMIHPRPRSLWSKWIEGLEAAALERRLSKPDIFEFYLNQVPYAAHRRGVTQAARYYFNRGLDTLNHQEILALAILVRAPSGYDLYQHKGKISRSMARLAANMDIPFSADDFTLEKPSLPVNAAHFASYLRKNIAPDGGVLRATLDGALQHKVQKIMDQRVATLQSKRLYNGAALVVDHTTGDILSWVVAGADDPKTPAHKINAVTVPRQPGSALKPFLYALALEKGWGAATILNDAPLAEAIGTGLHRFRNYSNVFYGAVTLRQALANSLNIPALRTIQYVGAAAYLNKLHDLGFHSLDRGVDIYDEGLALGNGEVTLQEVVQAYTALANRGVLRPLHFVMDRPHVLPSPAVYRPAVASLISDILSDSTARHLEFGQNSILSLPLQTAVKTGTSTDYRDAWAIGYNDKYIVGIWMGNLDGSVTDGVTGGTGPALALRSIFRELNLERDSRPLYLSPQLTRKEICLPDGARGAGCYQSSEYFLPWQKNLSAKANSHVELVKPTEGLQIALDPRIRQDQQKLEFVLQGVAEDQHVEWILNNEALPARAPRYLWPLVRGRHRLQVRVLESDGAVARVLAPVSYIVK